MTIMSRKTKNRGMCVDPSRVWRGPDLIRGWLSLRVIGSVTSTAPPRRVMEEIKCTGMETYTFALLSPEAVLHTGGVI